ncbi:MAG TPA: hypothetical protein VKX41_16940 [Alloacidobacterium sp.]|jgi:hypothetical protein|nr:hypothetical protein [Alloacidobacterium sp.]
MKRTVSIFSVLSLALIMTVAALGQAPTKPEHLSKHQLNTLIAIASTPAEHRRIAQYYRAKAQDYLTQSKEHEQMLAAYNANPSRGGKSRAVFIDHCESYSQYFKDMAVKSQGLATLHERMAKEAPEKLAPTGV